MEENKTGERRKQYHAVMSTIYDVGSAALNAAQLENFKTLCGYMDSYIDGVEDYLEAHKED